MPRNKAKRLRRIMRAPMHPGAGMEFRRTVGERKRPRRDPDPEKATKRLPPFGNVEHQQPLRRNMPPHLFTMPSKHPKRMPPIPHPPPEHLVGNGHALHQPAICRDRIGCRRRPGDLRSDRGGEARVPSLGRAQRQDHPRLWERRRKLAPVAGAWPIHLRAVSGKHRLPVHRLAARRGEPERDLLRVLGNLVHVVARAETELIQRKLQRVGPCSAEAGADHVEWHPCPPLHDVLGDTGARRNGL